MEITTLPYITSLSLLVFVIHHILSDQSWQFNLDFGINHTYTISHIVVLPSLHHRSYPIETIITVQFWFWRRVDLYNQPRHYTISSSSLIAHCLINLESKVSYSMEITPVQSITSLSCLLFMMDRILSDMSWQFKSYCNVNHNCTISDIVFLSGLHHRPYPIRSVMIV